MVHPRRPPGQALLRESLSPAHDRRTLRRRGHEAGRTDLRPENSHNINLNLSYTRQLGRHGLYVEGSYIYRDTKDYIKRSLDAVGGTSFASTRTMAASRPRASTSPHATATGVGSAWEARSTTSMPRRRAIPGRQHPAGEHDVQAAHPQSALYVRQLRCLLYLARPGRRGQCPDVTYDGFYQHEFPLYWEHLGDPTTRAVCPTSCRTALPWVIP